MLKKALIRTMIWDYISENNLKSTSDVMDKLPEIYNILREHKEYGNSVPLIPLSMTYEQFEDSAKHGKLNAEMFHGSKHFTFTYGV